jgi:hypothetical protein
MAIIGTLVTNQPSSAGWWTECTLGTTRVACFFTGASTIVSQMNGKTNYIPNVVFQVPTASVNASRLYVPSATPALNAGAVAVVIPAK